MRELRVFVAVLLSAIALHAKAAPQRIVTMLPSLTETVCVLGHCNQLVAVDDFSDWPEQVDRLPRVGGLDDAHIEKIVSLKPDIVLLAASSRLAGRLQAFGIKVVAFEPKTAADVHITLEKIGDLLGEHEAAERVWNQMNEEIDAAARSVPAARRGVRVYFEVASGPYAASEISHVGELLTRLHAADIVPGRLGSVPKLNPEFVVRADPEIIIVSASDVSEMRLRPGWDRVRAVRENHICALGSRDMNLVTRPGPRMGEAARILARCLAR
jgi:iron complex transport system substrate-binding protein